MRSLAIAAAVCLVVVASSDSTAKSSSVKGYVKKDGTYVAPHHRTTHNGTKLDNYGTKGNVNPYTGKEGTVDPLKVPSPTSTK